MKKIMFNDKYGLTQAVIEGRKTMTRRFLYEDYEKVYCNDEGHWIGVIPPGYFRHGDKIRLLPKYKVGETIAVAQSYFDIYGEACYEFTDRNGYRLSQTAGHHNKMFVQADQMPIHIRITNIKAELLQDITDMDCLSEGVYEWDDPFHEKGMVEYGFFGATRLYKTPIEAFSDLIDKVSGKGTWKLNPWVFGYEFKLVD